MRNKIKSYARPCICALVILAALAADVSFAAELGDAALRRENNNKVRQLCNAVRSGRYGAEKTFASCASNILALVSLPEGEGRPEEVSEFDACLAILHGAVKPYVSLPDSELVNNVVLRAQRTAKGNDQTALLEFARAQYLYFAAQDNDAAGWRKVMLNSVNTATNKAVKLDLCAAINASGAIPDYDYAAEGWKIVADEPSLYAAYVKPIFRRMRSLIKLEHNGIDEHDSAERLLELCQKILKSKEISENLRGECIEMATLAYCDLRRYEEAERMLVDWLATCEPESRTAAAMRLGDFYSQRATRYYAEPDCRLLARALGVYTNALLQSPDNGGLLRKTVSAALALGDMETAKKFVVRIVEITKDKTPDAFASAVLGTIAYAEGKWADASSYFKLHAARLSPENIEKYARALFAQGDLNGALEQLETLKVKQRWRMDLWNNAIMKIKSAAADIGKSLR